MPKVLCQTARSVAVDGAVESRVALIEPGAGDADAALPGQEVGAVDAAIEVEVAVARPHQFGDQRVDVVQVDRAVDVEIRQPTRTCRSCRAASPRRRRW